MSKSSWTRKQLEELYRLKAEGLTSPEIGNKINKSASACRRKYLRINWEEFFDGEAPSSVDPIKRVKSWSQQDMLQLYTYLDAEQSYSYIAQKLGRTTPSVEKKAQTTDWTAWHTATFHTTDNGEEEAKNEEQLIEQLVDAMVSLSRHDYSRIREMKKDRFFEKINFEESNLPVSFTDIKTLATKHLDECGLGNEERVSLGEGTYVVVGDSHGKHTTRKMFNLLQNVNNYFDADKLIHIGHLLDDDNEISFKWGDFDNLAILTKGEELKIVHKKRHSHNFRYDIIQSEMRLGNDLVVTNQDLISDYVKTPLRTLDNELFEGKMIVNCHRLETSSKACGDYSSHYICSPGSLCEKHIIRTIKQIDFQDGRTQKVAYSNTFSKYRRQEHMNEYWNQGILVVHVDEDGNHTIVPCIIKQINGEYYTSYFDKIISSKGVHNPTNKIFVHADMHSPSHDPGILDIQEQVCKDYKADVMVNIGDSLDVAALNHHEMDRGVVVFGDYLDECAKTYHIMKRMSTWAPKVHAIIGNHERFISDFVKKYPQLRTMLDFEFVCDLEALGYEITDLKKVLRIGDAKFIHGDILFYNQTGSKPEKASRTLGHNTFIGHIHYPTIRFGCYAIGFAGLLDQGYNESEASSWIHGLGFCNQYKGHSWPTTLAIFDHKLVLNGKTYEPQDPDSWNLSGFKARIVYETQESNS
jgi:hypothetical protein